MTGWKTRQIAIKALCAFENDKKLREHLEPLIKEFKPVDRAFIRELVSGTVRYLKLLDFCIEKATGKKLKRQLCAVRNALRLVAYQLMFTGVPEYAAINETVEAVKRLAGRKPAGFVNAVSKRLIGFDCKKEVGRIKDFYKRISTLYSFETWMVKRWHRFYGEELLPLLESLNRVAPLFVRVNLIKTTTKELLSIFQKNGIEAEPHPFIPHTVRVRGRVVVEDLPGFKEGLFYVQDPASYMAAYLLNPKPGELILDVGAAPGGKTTAIASLTKDRARVVAVDVSRERMELLKLNCRRLGIENVEPIITDIRRDDSFREKFHRSFDRILIDAPCSATGVIRRHPEGKWNKSMELIRHNQRIQRELLLSAKDLLKPGGVIVYSVCSLEKEEGEENRKFAKKMGFKTAEFEKIPEPLKERARGGELRLFPHRDNTDGFYYAAFRV